MAKALHYYDRQSEQLILTKKAFRLVRNHLEDLLYYEDAGGFFILHSGCPLLYRTRSLHIPEPERICSGCRHRLRKEVGSCRFRYKHDPSVGHDPVRKILSLLHEKSVPSSRTLLHQHRLACYYEFEAEEESIPPPLFSFFTNLMNRRKR